jgi:hypothetical protein
MSKVMYEYLFGIKLLYPTYMQLQMVDQSIRFLEGIAKDIMVKIKDHYAPTDFMALDMEEKDDSPIILEDRSSTLPMQSSTSDLDKSTSSSLERRYVVTLTVILLMSSRRRIALGGGHVDHPTIKRINSLGMNGGLGRRS